MKETQSRFSEGRILFDREDLALTIDLILNGDKDAPLLLAQLLVSFRQAIESGLHGINQTRQALADAVELIYSHSPLPQAVLNLYRLSIEGQLKVEDEPLELINAAIERATSRPGKVLGRGQRTPKGKDKRGVFR